MSEFKEFFEANKKMWDIAVGRNLKNQEIYKTKELLQGEVVLNSIELEEIGDVKGKKLLHLQCHFGLDTLSWARLGAEVTGIDFSSEAIKLAKSLTEKTSLNAKFIRGNIYDLPDILEEKFDIVYTSYGVLCWLNDINRWAEIVAHFLRPGGMFYIAEFHPFIQVFDYDNTEDFKLRHNYFFKPEPIVYDEDYSSEEEKKKSESAKTYEWIHGIGNIITALINSGLRIQFLHEFNKAPFPRFHFLNQSKDGYWYYNNPDYELPLVYSLKAIKE